MGTELQAVEEQLMSMRQDFAQLLPKLLPPEKLARTIVLSCERTPKLLQMPRQSLINSAWSAATLGLECDGVTGQGFLIPFGGRNPCVQLLVGYKGYNSMAHRAGFIVKGAVVYEGDEFDFQMGTESYVNHVKKLGGRNKKIIGAWAQGAGQGGLRTTPVVLDIDELEAIKAKSAGAKKADSPWNDRAIGFAAMCEKSAKRRLARSIPQQQYQLANGMENFVDQGRGAWVDPDNGVQTYDQPTQHDPQPGDAIEGEFQRAAPASAPADMCQPATYKIYLADGTFLERDTVSGWIQAIKGAVQKLRGDTQKLQAFYDRQKPAINAVEADHPDAADWVRQHIEDAIRGL